MRINRAALRAIRERSGLSLNQLAKDIGSSASFITEIEKGEKNPSERTIRRLAVALKVSTTAIILDPEPEQVAQ